MTAIIPSFATSLHASVKALVAVQSYGDKNYSVGCGKDAVPGIDVIAALSLQALKPYLCLMRLALQPADRTSNAGAGGWTDSNHPNARYRNEIGSTITALPMDPSSPSNQGATRIDFSASHGTRGCSHLLPSSSSEKSQHQCRYSSKCSSQAK